MTLNQTDKKIHDDYVDLMKSRLDWAVETERYEMAARLRDLVEYETTEDENFKRQYYLNLVKKYYPEFYETIKDKPIKTNKL